MRPELRLDEIADAILDGTPVDWTIVDSSVAIDAPDERALVAQLKTLEVLRLGRTSARPGRNWGHLQVFERIGQGAYGDVYRAWDTRLDCEVALKLLPPDEPVAAASDSKVIDEGRLLARVRHPNVVTIYGAERIDGRVGLWMEYVKGRTLEEVLQDGQKFTVAEVTRLGVELCRAVSAVHAAGLLHRDVKAQNVMLDESGRLVLMDFGTGRELEATDKQIAGTPLYLAPEVLSGGAATPQSDAYSIGVVLFRLLTNTYPVSGADLADLRRAHAAGGGGDARVDRSEIPQRLRRVLARAIDPDPARRHRSVDELAAALAAAERAPGRRRAAMAVAAVAALGVAGAIGWNLGLRDLVMPAPPVIAVLPFRNVSSDPANDDFVDGLTGEVIRDLSTIDGLQVRPRASSFYFKDRPRDLGEVAKKLDVDLVVEADVQRVGNRLRIDVQLVRISENVPLWAEKFDRSIDDVFAIQDEISRAIVNKLRLTLGRGQRRYTTNPATYDLYLRGRALLWRGGATGADAVKLFQQAIAMDETFALAHAGLAEAYSVWSWRPSGPSYEQAIAAMRPAAQRAIDLDPLLAEAHAAMAITFARELNWESARKSFEHAIGLSPFLSHIYVSYADALYPVGEAEKAEELLTAALTRDPLSRDLRRELGLAQYVAGHYADAVANLQQAHAEDPTLSPQILARALTKMGRPEEALAVFNSRPEYRDWERWMMPAYLMANRTADVERLIRENKDEIPHRRVIIYAALGDKERTLEALGPAVDVLPQRVAFMLACPEMAFLRGDPRLGPLRKRLNLR